MHFGCSICFKLEELCVRNIGCFVDYMVLFSFLKLTLLTKGCGIWGMRVVIVNIYAEVLRKLILLCSSSCYLINRRIKIAFFKHWSWVSFFLRHTVEMGLHICAKLNQKDICKLNSLTKSSWLLSIEILRDIKSPPLSTCPQGPYSLAS